MSLKKGFVHVYTGNGKGKTTAAIGLGVRAAGAGLRVIMIQFMKGRRYSELDALHHLPNFTVVQFGRDEFVSKEKPEQVDINLANKGLRYAQEVIQSNTYDLVILDEVNVALDYQLIPLQDVLELISKKPTELELVCTGRYAPAELVKDADIVSEILEIKHPFQTGVVSRKGIDW
mgnify:CR=1 FL=1